MGSHPGCEPILVALHRCVNFGLHEGVPQLGKIERKKDSKKYADLIIETCSHSVTRKSYLSPRLNT